MCMYFHKCFLSLLRNALINFSKSPKLNSTKFFNLKKCNSFYFVYALINPCLWRARNQLFSLATY